VLGLERGDVGHGGEDVGAVDDRTLDAVALVDAPVPGLLVQYELHTTGQLSLLPCVGRCCGNQHLLALSTELSSSDIQQMASAYGTKCS